MLTNDHASGDSYIRLKRPLLLKKFKQIIIHIIDMLFIKIVAQVRKLSHKFPPLLNSTFLGRGKRASHVESNRFMHANALGLPLSWDSSNHPVTWSTIVNTCILYFVLFLLQTDLGFHNSTFTQLRLVISPIFSGTNLNFFLPEFLLFWHTWQGAQTYSTSVFRSF